MKKIIFILLILISASGFAKNIINERNSVSIKLTNRQVSVAMEMIKKQTGMEFDYNPQVINTNHLISVDIADKDVESALALLFNDIYSYKVKGKYIMITSEKKIIPELTDNEVIDKNYKKNEETDSGKEADNCISSIRERKISLERIEPGQPLTITNYKNNNIMLRKIAGIIALSAITAGQITAGTGDVEPKIVKYDNLNLEQSVAQLSFLFPMGTDGNASKDKNYKFSINMLGGITGGVDGAELGGIFNINKQNVKGFQAAGIFNYVEGGVSGLQLAGVMNYSNNNGGAQMAGVLNYSKEYSKFQAAGIFNYAETSGIQMSVVNIAKKRKFQLGLVNISDTADGASLGLFNYSKEGGLLEVGVSANDYIYGAVNLITGNDKLYSIISVGAHSSSLSLGVGLGTRIRMKSEKNGVNFELMQVNIVKNDLKDMGTNAYLHQLRVFYSYRINKFTAYAGPTVNGLLKDVDFDGANKPIYTIIENNGSKHDFNLWVGAELGVRINLK